MRRLARHALTLAVACAALTGTAEAQLSKEACVDAHSRGQDAREQGKISLARKLFLTCAQSSCPGAVQGDCARFADDLTSMQPTIVFVARDSNGNDLPATSVYVDGMLVATSIDGKPHDIDPGNHVVKFSNGGRDEVVTVVIGSGEKGRTVQARFAAQSTSSSPSASTAPAADRPAPRRAADRTSRPKGAMAFAVTGGILALAGAGLAVYGHSRIPAACSLGSNTCAAPPGDPVFAEARSAATTINVGLIATGAGAVVFAGGVVWYLTGAKKTRERPAAQAIAPWLTGTGGGVAMVGQF